MTLVLGASFGLLLAACNSGSKSAPPSSAAPEPSAAPAPAQAAAEGALRFGAPIEASAEEVALTTIAKEPASFVGKTFATTGTVTAVCQRMGCWMELKDDAGEAHVKMAGHAFFVPKNASGRKARVLAKLVPSEETGMCEGDHHHHDKMAAAGGEGEAKKSGCRAEAEAHLGRPLAKLELVADGVELL